MRNIPSFKTKISATALIVGVAFSLIVISDAYAAKKPTTTPNTNTTTSGSKSHPGTNTTTGGSKPHPGTNTTTGGRKPHPGTNTTTSGSKPHPGTNTTTSSGGYQPQPSYYQEPAESVGPTESEFQAQQHINDAQAQESLAHEQSGQFNPVEEEIEEEDTGDAQ